MAEKKAIDRQREAGISMEIGGGEDREVKGVLPIGGVMHIIKLADDIDP